MAIILKNNLSGKVTFGTDIPAGSGYVEPNGGTTDIPKGTTKISWTVEKGASPGNFATNEVIDNVKDNYVYTIDVSKKPI